ncbi:MAG: hypothetical protein Q9220_000436 [cf. Caloplaca sp. 1 TL-2023]
MANGFGESTIYGPDLTLTQDQQSLLKTALSSNNPDNLINRMSAGPNAISRSSGSPMRNGNASPAQPSIVSQRDAFFKSPIQDTITPVVDNFGLEDSPFVDGQDFEDGNFDWDNNGGQLFDDLPGEGDHDDDDIHDKRKNDHEDEEEDGTNKRHEGNDKGSRKPGRKPLNSSEPTTKRKAQNRAAQRAFRERKERHLKDLETKVEDLEKASEATNHENGRLRATVDRLNTEVKEYRKRLSLTNTGYSPPSTLAPQSSTGNNSNDFQFAFPKFGDLPGSTFMSNGSIAKVGTPYKNISRTPSGNTVGPTRAVSSSSGNGRSPATSSLSPVNQNRTSSMGSISMGGMQASPTGFPGSGVEELNGLFSPSILESVSRSNSIDYMFPTTNNTASQGASQTSKEASNSQHSSSNGHRASSASITASPSVSSVSHGGMDSSCGTTPEPSADSPGTRKASEGTLNTINEEAGPQKSFDNKRFFCDEWATACGNTINPVPRTMSQQGSTPALPSSMTNNPASDINGIDWMARQNGGQFDPVLFNDYRDTQDDLISNEFFSDAFLNQDFSTPFNMPDETISSEPKKDLMQHVEEAQNGGSDEVVPADPQQFLTCDKLWDRVQQSEKAQTGEVDMDDLCSQLKAKAKCSGSGAVIEQKDVDAILGPPPDAQKDFLKMFK